MIRRGLIFVLVAVLLSTVLLISLISTRTLPSVFPHRTVAIAALTVYQFDEHNTAERSSLRPRISFCREADLSAIGYLPTITGTEWVRLRSRVTLPSKHYQHELTAFNQCTRGAAILEDYDYKKFLEILYADGMSVQTEPHGIEQSFASSAQIMFPKNGSRRGGIWPGFERNLDAGRNGELDRRPLVPEFTSTLPDPHPLESYREPGSLHRYNSAPGVILSSISLLDYPQDHDGLNNLFAEADLAPLSTSIDSRHESMDTEQAESAFFDEDEKFLLDHKFDMAVPSSELGSVGGGIVPLKSLQPSYKHSMEVLLENPGESPTPILTSSMAMSSTMSMSPSVLPSTMSMPSSVGLSTAMMSSTMGLSAGLVMPSNMGLSHRNVDFHGSLSSVVSPSSIGGHPGFGNSNCSGLRRQSSSPAGLIAHLSIDRHSPGTPSPEDSLSGATSEENGPGMLSGMDSLNWDDVATSSLTRWSNERIDELTARKRYRADRMDMLDVIAQSSTSDRSSLEHGPPPGGLIRHMSLPTPKTKNNTNALPDDLQSVPMRSRAKRGMATHPRSIAERVRRTRISERMRKLQELVPNMDKQQTNTADMLDEAVEYVKLLQRQVQEATERWQEANDRCLEATERYNELSKELSKCTGSCNSAQE